MNKTLISSTHLTNSTRLSSYTHLTNENVWANQNHWDSTNALVTNKDDIDMPLMALFPSERLSMKWTRVHSVGAGLQNIANTCYMNSTLQCLTYTPPLTNFLMTREHSSECNSPKDKFCMMCTLEKHIVKTFSNSGKAIYPIDVLWKLPYIGGHFGFGHQEDAHEFLQATINALQDSCLNGMELDSATETKTFIHQVFGGLFRSRITCLNCNRVSDTFEPFTDIPVDVERTDNINNALVDFVAPEQLDGESAYCCSKCQQMVTATKECNIYRSSNILTIMLKRFSAIFGQKIGKYVEYPEYLDMEPYMSDNNIGPQRYSLYAVLIHSGDNVYAGHYYCYIKSSDGRWYFMDDCLVTESDIKTVLRQHAYILFYAKSNEEETTKGGGQMRLNTVIADQASTEPNVMPQDNATIHHCTYAVNLSLSPQMTEDSHSDTVTLSGVTSLQDCEESKTSDMEHSTDCSRCTAYSQESRKMCHPQHGYTWDSQSEHDHQSQLHPPLQDRSKLDESLQELSHQGHSEGDRSEKMRSHRKIVHRFQPYKHHSHRHKSQQDLSKWSESNNKRSEWDESYKMRLHQNLVHQNWPNKHWSNWDDSQDNLSHKSFPHQNRSIQDESYQTQSHQNRVYRPYQHWSPRAVSRQENSAQNEAHQDLTHHKRSDHDHPNKLQMPLNPVHSFQPDHRPHSGKSYQARSDQDEVHRQNLSHQYKSYQTQSHQNRVDRPYQHQSPRVVSHKENSAQDKAHQDLTKHNHSDWNCSNKMRLHRNRVHRFQPYQHSHSGKPDQVRSDWDETHRDLSYHKLSKRD